MTLREGSALEHLLRTGTVGYTDQPAAHGDAPGPEPAGREQSSGREQSAGQESGPVGSEPAKQDREEPGRAGSGREQMGREQPGPEHAGEVEPSGPEAERATCGFCGETFVEDRRQATCQACPLSRACGLMRCPHCGYENPKQPAWITRLKEWIG